MKNLCIIIERILKNIANYISISRVLMSMILLIPETFSFSFNIVYIYCRISDILDGFIARRIKGESEIGNRLDSAVYYS